jgi:protein phosphatase
MSFMDATDELAQAQAEPSAVVGQPFARVTAAGRTDRGLRRERNEDQFVIAELTRAMHIQASSLPQAEVLFGSGRVRGHLFIVADGMGGHEGGEEASALAVTTIEDFLLRALHWFFRLQGDAVLEEFQSALRTADERIFDETRRRPDLQGMGTTFTLAYVVGRVLYVAHVGDSRLYLSRGGELHQLTNDHTVAGELVRQHVIDDEAARQHPMRNIVTNSLGGAERGVHPEVQKLPLGDGDTLLLCTDGLTEMVPPTELAQTVARSTSPEETCERLVARANELGGRDNITVIVAHFEG